MEPEAPLATERLPTARAGSHLLRNSFRSTTSCHQTLLLNAGPRSLCRLCLHNCLSLGYAFASKTSRCTMHVVGLAHPRATHRTRPVISHGHGPSLATHPGLFQASWSRNLCVPGEFDRGRTPLLPSGYRGYVNSGPACRHNCLFPFLDPRLSFACSSKYILFWLCGGLELGSGPLVWQSLSTFLFWRSRGGVKRV